VGYSQTNLPIEMDGNDINTGKIALKKRNNNLEEIVVIAKSPAVTQKEDTSQYSANQYKVNIDATTEDLLKKMPGISVDKSGTITAQGEQVKKITIDGKEFFGEDATSAVRNIPAEVVDKIQVFDRLSDQAQLTGIDDGNSQKAINVITKNGIKNSQFGRIFAGYGTDKRYSAGGNASFFNNDRRISIVASFNNINQQNFGSQDLLGVMGSAAAKTPGPPAGFRGPGNQPAETFTVGQSNGISKTNAFGINYGDKWGKNINVIGSYFFNNSDNDNISFTKTLLFQQKQASAQNSTIISQNDNHRINARIEFKLDSNDIFFMIPNISFQTNNASGYTGINSYRNNADSVYNSDANTITEKKGYSIRNNMLYRHSFQKKGRSLSMGFNFSVNKNDGFNTINGQYRFYDLAGMPFFPDSVQQQNSLNLSNGYSYGGNITYTEPIGKKGQLQLEYNPSIQKNDADQRTYLFDGTSYTVLETDLSNTFNNSIIAQNGGITYRYTKNRDDQFAIGTNYQQTKLTSDRLFPSIVNTNQRFYNFLPNGYWRKKISKYSSFRIFYRTSTLTPAINQLQDVYNISNPLRVICGNPSLKQSFTQYMGGRFMHTNTKNNRSIFTGIFFQTAEDFISNSSIIASGDSALQKNIILKKGTQLIKPVNLDGYRLIRSYFTYSSPLNFIKSTLNLNVSMVYSRLPGLINSIKTTTDNYQFNAGFVLSSNINEYIDYTLSYNANLNDAKTTGGTVAKNRFINHVTNASIRLSSKNGWFIQSEITNQIFKGLSGNLDQNFNLLNAAVGKKFLKNQAGELKISVFDLLKQNQNLSRNVTNTFIEDTRSNIIRQYFMLTFTYSLRNFGTAKKSAEAEERTDMMHRMGYPGN
ncbi:MAG: hypothetical protein FGM46_03515, partial [Ferruginibacter sp.]|nr:hypothetical protein [Ferruginibacter sp.]